MQSNKLGTFDPNTNNGFLFFIFLVGVVLPAYWLPGALKLLTAFPLGWLGSRVTFKVLSAIKRRAEKDAIGEWNGRHYAYEGQQIRIHWDDETIWLTADDVFSALGRKPDSTERAKIRVRVGEEGFRELPEVDGTCFSEAGIMRYLAFLPEPETRKIRRWLERDVLRNIHRLREIDGDAYRRHRLPVEVRQ